MSSGTRYNITDHRTHQTRFLQNNLHAVLFLFQTTQIPYSRQRRHISLPGGFDILIRLPSQIATGEASWQVGLHLQINRYMVSVHLKSRNQMVSRRTKTISVWCSAVLVFKAETMVMPSISAPRISTGISRNTVTFSDTDGSSLYIGM